jgi:hypothetical protein
MAPLNPVGAFQLGWRDGISRRAGASFRQGLDAESYWRGITRAARFIRIVQIRADEAHDPSTSSGDAGRRAGAIRR